LCIFVVCSILFHLPIVWFKLTRKRTTDQSDIPTWWQESWECTDYFWFGVSTLALITAANEVTKLYSENEVSFSLPRPDFLTGDVHKNVVDHAEVFEDPCNSRLTLRRLKPSHV
jgi:hypothetical protein